MSRASIDQEVIETMELLERPDDLPPDPLFYGRVTARLAEKRRPARGSHPVLKPVLIAALVILNVVTAAFVLSGRSRPLPGQARQKLVESLAGDLNLADEGQALFFDN